MKIRFRESEEVFNVDVSIVEWRTVIELRGDDLPTDFSQDFDVLNDEDVIVDYFEGFYVVYDSGEGYVQLTDDTNTYYDYLVADSEGYVVSTYVSTEEVTNGDYLYQSGQGKQFKHFVFDAHDESGIIVFKIVDGKLVEIMDDEKQELYAQLEAQNLESAKAAKVIECSQICANLIESGVDVDIDGQVEHFSYTKDEDQINLFELFTLSSQTNVPMNYHPDGGSCKTYTTEQIIAIYATASTNKNHHTTYFNQLRDYINALTSIEEVQSVVYGQELTGEYLETYNSSMAQAQLVLETLLAQRQSAITE